MTYSKAGIALSGIMIFLCGTAVGQKTNSNKFSKYLKPTVFTEMDIRLLNANLDALRGSTPLTNFGAPAVTYDIRLKGIKMSVYTPEHYFNKEPLESVKSKLPGLVEVYYDLYIRPYFPDVTKSEIVVLFTDPGTGRGAEYKNDRLDFH